MASHTILMEQQSKHLSFLQENQVQTVQISGHITKKRIKLYISQTGETESQTILKSSAIPSQFKTEINCVNQSSNLKSNVKPRVLLEKPPELKVLKVNKVDIKILCQVIAEFQEQFNG